MANVGCENLVIACMDYRLHDGLQAVMRRFDGERGGVDIVRIAGAARNLGRSADIAQRAFVLEQIATALSLHQIERVILVNHEDCGAYGPEGKADPAGELATHARDLRAAAELVRATHPGIEVQALFLRLDGRVEKVEA